MTLRVLPAATLASVPLVDGAAFKALKSAQWVVSVVFCISSCLNLPAVGPRARNWACSGGWLPSTFRLWCRRSESTAKSWLQLWLCWLVEQHGKKGLQHGISILVRYLGFEDGGQRKMKQRVARTWLLLRCSVVLAPSPMPRPPLQVADASEQ
jgi:hypothetical protein